MSIDLPTFQLSWLVGWTTFQGLELFSPTFPPSNTILSCFFQTYPPSIYAILPGLENKQETILELADQTLLPLNYPFLTSLTWWSLEWTCWCFYPFFQPPSTLTLTLYYPPIEHSLPPPPPPPWLDEFLNELNLFLHPLPPPLKLPFLNHYPSILDIHTPTDHSSIPLFFWTTFFFITLYFFITILHFNYPSPSMDYPFTTFPVSRLTFP